MNTIFIGGSRHVSRLPTEVKKRLDNVIGSGHRVIVGDANGADKAVQKHLQEAGYDKVTVFCSGSSPRNNLGEWTIRDIHPLGHAKGFQFYAAKDRAMAQEADFGLMIWDGKSPGTMLNVLRLVRAGKIAVLFDLPKKVAINIKTPSDWDSFLNTCGAELRSDLRDRATPEEWEPAGPMKVLTATDLAANLNAALATGDPATIVDALGVLAKASGMSTVAKNSGLARESLYRALGAGGNPEFATVLKVMSSLGLRLTVSTAPEAQAAE